MKQTILITGTSTGIGRATVKHFSERGWQVAATMRNPQKETEMQTWPGVRLYQLDVTDTGSINAAFSAAVQDFDTIDAICNNAGYGAVGIFEKATEDQIRKQFDTNVLGCMNVIRAALPYFRKKRKGLIINVTSMGGLVCFPLYSVYHGTKWAMEGFSESLAFELRPLGIRVKCIEPGSIKTDFNSRSQDLFINDQISDYDTYEKITYANTQKIATMSPGPEMVAKTIYRAATDGKNKLRYTTDMQGAALLALKRMLPNRWLFGMVRMILEKGIRKQEPKP